jgi:hypothetical protein
MTMNLDGLAPLRNPTPLNEYSRASRPTRPHRSRITKGKRIFANLSGTDEKPFTLEPTEFTHPDAPRRGRRRINRLEAIAARL